MKISLNGVELARSAEGNQTIAQVLAEIQEEIKRSGSIVTSVFLDCQPLATGWKRHERLSAPVSSVRAMELTVDNPQRLKSQMIEDASPVGYDSIAEGALLAMKFRVGDEVTANNDLAELLDELKLIMSSLDHLTRNKSNVMDSSRMQVQNTANGLLPTLDRIYRAQAASDFVTIADEIEYELPEHAALCGRILSQMDVPVANPSEQ